MEFFGQHLVFDAASETRKSGGMADVYFGTIRDRSDERVAIKVPRADLDERVKELFLREAEAAMRVSGEHVVRVIDWGDQPPFIAFEFIDGGTLDEDLRQRANHGSPRDPSNLVLEMRQLVAALDAINEYVIHRDLKPENIFIQGSTLKVGDFGIAKYVGEVTRTKTFKGWGTPHYMAPEAFERESVDWRADQYSLGVVFFEMATLRLPFHGDWDELRQKHLFERPARITGLVDNCTERLASLVARMLEKRKENRFHSWEDVRRELSATTIVGVTPDPLATEAAKRMEIVRSRALANAGAAEEHRNELAYRRAILSHWSDEIEAEVRARIGRVNESLGEAPIEIDTGPTSLAPGNLPLRWWIRLSFLDSTASFEIEVVPVEEQGLLLWGKYDVGGAEDRMAANLILRKEPVPYGSWWKVELHVSGLMRTEFRPQDQVGGLYEVFGRERSVIALNWQALQYQRSRRNIVSGVNYSEGPILPGLLVSNVVERLIVSGSPS